MDQQQKIQLKDFTPNLENLVDFRQILHAIMRRKWLVIASVIIFMAIGWAYTKFRTPIYQSTMLMQVNSNSNFNTTGNNGNVVVFSWGNSVAASLAKIIPSRDVLTHVIDNLHLDTVVQPRYFPVFGHAKAERYDSSNYANQPAKSFWGLSQYNWGGNNIKVSQFQVSQKLIGHVFTLKIVSDEKYILLNGGKSLGQGSVGQPLSLSLGPYEKITINVDKIHAAPRVEFRIHKINKNLAIAKLASGLKVQAAEGSRDLMELSYKDPSPTRAAEMLRMIANAAMANQIEGQARQASKVLAFLHQQLPKTKRQLNQAELKLNHYLSEHGGIDLSTKSKALVDQLIQADTKIAELQFQLSQLKERYTNKSVQVKDLEGTIALVIKQKQQLLGQLKALPTSEQTQINLQRESEVQNKIYESLLEKIQQYQLMRAGTIGSLSVVDDANEPLGPTNIPASNVRAIYGIVGLILGLIYVFIEAYFITGITSPELVEEKFGLSIISTVHESKMQVKQVQAFNKKEKSHLEVLAEMDHADLSTESFRSLRTYLFFELPDAKNNIIAIYGPTPNVGKSFATANLGHMLSATGQKVLVIDGDIRRGNLHDYFVSDHSTGLSEVISGKAPLKHAIQKTRFDNLDFLPRGNISIDHVELLMRTELKKFLEKVSKEYDYVIIDTAPVLAVSDALLIAPHVGTNILVLGYGKHDQHELQITMDRFNKAKVQLKGFLFNRISDSYSYYGTSKYNYRYHYKPGHQKKA